MAFSARDIVEYRGKWWMILDWNHAYCNFKDDRHGADIVNLVSWEGRSLMDAYLSIANHGWLYKLPRKKVFSKTLSKYGKLISSHRSLYRQREMSHCKVQD